MTIDDLSLLSLLSSAAMIAANNNEKPIDRPCDRCGGHFDSGSFLIGGGRVISIMCTACHGPADELDEEPRHG